MTKDWDEKEALKYKYKALLKLGGIVSILAFMYGKNYQIDGNVVRDGRAPWNQIVEYKGKDKIKYHTIFLEKNNYVGVKINEKEYYDKNNPVNIEGKERFHYLQSQIKSIKQAEKEAKVHRKLEKKTMETEEALNILRR